MDKTVPPGRVKGTLTPPCSKSYAQRALAAALLSEEVSVLRNIEFCDDTRSALQCIETLGARVRRVDSTSLSIEGGLSPKGCVLNVGESGLSTRLFTPVASLCPTPVTIEGRGSLLRRPMQMMFEPLRRLGVRVRDNGGFLPIEVCGPIQGGEAEVDGSVSSQFITGLLLSAALIPGKSRIRLTGKVESRPYITMTQRAMVIFGKPTSDFAVTGGTPFRSPGTLTVEGDWSNAAFFLAAKALGSRVEVTNLSPDSPQGDRAVFDLLPALEGHPVISAADIPDLVPILAVTAACKNGGVFTDIRRLRLKESDRVASVIAMVEALGGKAQASEDTLTVYGTGLVGGTVDAMNDHRIAMSAAIAATACKAPVAILGAECVGKSYPKFFEEYARLGGNYEQYLR